MRYFEISRQAFLILKESWANVLKDQQINALAVFIIDSQNKLLNPKIQFLKN
jgi:hypothetical protein